MNTVRSGDQQHKQTYEECKKIADFVSNEIFDQVMRKLRTLSIHDQMIMKDMKCRTTKHLVFDLIMQKMKQNVC